MDPQSVKNFDTLYKDHADLIYRFAHRLCGEPEAAKDLVQETFLNAYRGFDKFRGDARISTWLYTIASRACLRMRRRMACWADTGDGKRHETVTAAA